MRFEQALHAAMTARGWSESFAPGSLAGCFDHDRPIDGHWRVWPQHSETCHSTTGNHDPIMNGRSSLRLGGGTDPNETFVGLISRPQSGPSAPLHSHPLLGPQRGRTLQGSQPRWVYPVVASAFHRQCFHVAAEPPEEVAFAAAGAFALETFLAECTASTLHTKRSPAFRALIAVRTY